MRVQMLIPPGVKNLLIIYLASLSIGRNKLLRGLRVANDLGVD
jgi:hypothetical protein